MEEIFKGLIERSQYYEQFESFRNINHLKTNRSKITYSKEFIKISETDLKMKVSLICV
jgi:hypothetical protein